VKTRPTPPLTAAQREALEARFALRVSARLEEGAQAVPHDIAERLRVAREQAVRAAREARAAVSMVPVSAPSHVAVGVGATGLSGAGGGQVQTGTGLMGNWNESAHARSPGRGRSLGDGPPSWGWRMAAVLPLVVLVVGLIAIQRYARIEQVETATEIDMQLLTDDLPPDAYADPGFKEFLSRDSDPVRPMEDAPPEIGDGLADIESSADMTQGMP
jgi:hypothetical protein